MLIDELENTARTLLNSRARAIASRLADLERASAGKSSLELTEELAHASRDERMGIGLVLARAVLEEAVAAPSRQAFGNFLFRFAAHLKTSVSQAGISPAQRLAVATATAKLFDSLPTATPGQRIDASNVKQRLGGHAVSDRDWQTVLGVTEVEFNTLIEKFARELRPRQPLDSRQQSQLVRRETLAHASIAVPIHQPPAWLVSNYSSEPDPLVSSTANWSPRDVEVAQSTSLTQAWSEFLAARYTEAGISISELQSKVGPAWGPTSAADVLRSWNWIRLVTELAAIENSEASDPRRSWTSICEFQQRCLPGEDLPLTQWLELSIGDFVATDLASKRAWSAYTTRLVSVLGHEEALANYTNQQKASLRQIWAETFGLTSHEARSTATAAAEIESRYRRTTQKLYLGARNEHSPARTLREAAHTLPELLDEYEGSLFAHCLELASDAERLFAADGTNHRDLSDLINELGRTRVIIAGSGSAILQDFVAPLLGRCVTHAEQATLRLGDISRPEVSLRLTSSKLPFSAASGSPYEIRILATNSGNAPAEAISLHVTESALGIDEVARIDLLGPGSESEVILGVIATGSSPKAVQLQCDLQWTDSLLQQFSGTQRLPAEDQMAVAWTPDDINPFKLGTITEPERLVGRDDDLASLDALLAGNASAYITGHKRVGKTSLTRVLLNATKDKRGWAGSLLPLGRALGEDQTAGDLVYALLDEILDAASQAYFESVETLDAVESVPGANFARTANRWLRTISRALPPNARVVIAIDDFDELPDHLIKGPQADALFLFLRSLVDEPWLNLIVVGSEILPSIIQAQAHKLNQVVPVSVTNFSSRASTAELLSVPTSDRLEWEPAAIDRVHYLCGGNPYYETLLAQGLWQTMRENSRSVVTEGDIEEAARTLARNASESHFIHLWADSSSGLNHTTRSAIVASAVLRSIALCGGPLIAPASPEEVARHAQSWIQTATTEELSAEIANLKKREVLRVSPSTDRLLISIPLVGIWLQGAGGRALDGTYAMSKHAVATVRMITDLDLVTLSRNLRYRGEQISEIRIRAWLEQFGGNDRQYLAYKMLRRMVSDGYFTAARLQNTEIPRLVSAISKLPAYRVLTREANNHSLRNAYLLSHGVAGDSTQGAVSLLAKALKIKKANVVEHATLAERVRNVSGDVVLFVLDDYCGTGTHLSRELEQLSSTVATLGEGWADRIHVVVGACVVADEKSLPSFAEGLSVEGAGGTFLTDRFRPFSPQSGVFDSPKEQQEAFDMVSSIGKTLVPNNPLGFGGQALLTLMEFNCPNNVAPIFWKSGTVSQSKWLPLFERAT